MKRWIIAAAAALLLLVLLGAWQIGLFSSDPEEANLADAIAAELPESSDDGSVDDAVAVEPESSGAVETVADLDGEWSVRASEGTFVGYRINEILSGIDFTAVGRTAAVTGTLEGDGAAITAVDVTADLTGLESDSSIRDGQLRSQALETSQFPTARFVLSEPIPVDVVPAAGIEAEFMAAGELEIHGVTREVTIPLRATTADGRLFVVGSIDVALADYDIDTPSARRVAGVSDTATMEFSLIFSR